MKLARICTFAAVTAAAVLATAQPAEATTARCELVAQPWDGRSYALTAVVDGIPQPLITRQSGLLDGRTAWEFDAGSITEVWWAAKDPARQAVAADFYDVLPVKDCAFTVAYHATPGKPDSVIIRPVATPPTSTSTTEPEPTITFATTPTTVAPPAVTPTTSTAVDVPPSAAPTTTTPAPTLPPVPASSTTSPVELFTATSVEQTAATALPATGNRPLRAGLGVLFISGGLGLWFLSLRPLRARTIKENQPS